MITALYVKNYTYTIRIHTAYTAYTLFLRLENLYN